MKLKHVLGLFSLIFVGILLVSCGKKDDEVVKIWAWNKNVDIMNDAVVRYQNINPDFKAEVESFSQNDIDKKFVTSSQLKDGSLIGDVILTDTMKLRGYYDAWPEIFTDFKEYGVTSEVTDNFVQSTIDLSTINNKLVAMPFGIAPTVVFAYKPLWEEDMLESIVKNGWTWEEYKEYGLNIKEKFGSDVYMTSYDLRHDDRLYRTMVSQRGQWFMDKELNVVIDNENSIEAMTYVKEFHDGDIINHNDTGDYKSEMKNGKIAAQIQGFFLGGQLKDIANSMSGDWKILPLPRFSDMTRSDSITGGSYLYVNNTIESSKKEVASKFVKWLTINEENTMKSLDIGGIYPALTTAYELDKFKNSKDEFFDYQTVLFDVSEFTKHAPTIYPSKYNSFNYDAFILEQENILFNNKNIIESLKKAKQAMIENAQK